MAQTSDGALVSHALSVTYDGRRVVAFRATFAGPHQAMVRAFAALFRLAAVSHCPPYILLYRTETGTPLVSHLSV